MTQDATRLLALLRAKHPALWICTHEECDALDVVRDAASGLDANLWRWSVTDGVRNQREPHAAPIPDTLNPAGALVWLQRRDETSLCTLLDLGAHLDDPHVRRALLDLVDKARATGSHVVLIDREPRLPDSVRAHVTPFELSLPDEDEIEPIVREALKRMHREKPVKIDLTKRDYRILIKNLAGLSRRQIEQVVYDLVAEDRTFDAADLNRALARKRILVSGAGLLDSVESPTTLDDVGGLDQLKAWLAARERSFTDEAAEFGLTPPRGVLLLGVQGAGKSLCAKAIATAWRRPLLRMDPGSLYDKFVGESERRLRDALRQAEAMAPNVLWIDEIEKAFASAAAHSTDGGLSQRMFGTLLTWMQDHEAPVFLVATANNIDALPPELLRKGRFDEIFFVDLPSEEARRQILEIHLRRRHRDSAMFDLDALAAACDGYSGAEIESAVLAALHVAFHENREPTSLDIERALRGSPPLSITMAEQVARLRAWAEGRCVPAG
ncbi:MAG: AAA family ATPase [Phycisphaerales bacterium]